MKKLMHWIVAHPRACLFASILLTGVFAFGVPRVQIDSSANILLVPGDPDRVYYDDVREIFGDDVLLSIVVEADDVFRSDVLQAIENLTADAEALDGVTRVISLATVTDVRSRDGALGTDELMPYVPAAEERELIERIRDNALHNEIFHGEIVSPDGTTAAVNLFIADDPDDKGFNESLTGAVQQLIDRELDALGSGAGVDIYQTGVPKMKVDMIRSIRRDMMTLLPVSFLVIFVVLFALYRSLTAVVVPLVTGVLSIVITVGFMGFAGLQLTPVTLIIPLLLVVVGATEDIHLISEYGLALASGLDKREAIRAMGEKGGLAIFLTALTTLFGFATIITNDIPVLADFGKAASFGMLANFVVTILVVPHLLALFPASPGLAWENEPAEDEGKDKDKGKGKGAATGRLERLAGSIARLASRRRRLVLGLSAGVAAVCLVAAQRIVINTDYLSFFHTDAPIRKAFDRIGERLAGAQSFYVVVDTGEVDGLKDSGNFRSIVSLSDFLASKTDKVSGFANLIRKIHREMNEGKEGAAELPDTPGLIAQYALMLDQDDLARFVDDDYSMTCLLARTKMSGSHEIRAFLPQIEAFVRENLPGRTEVKVTGEMILVANASDRIGEGIIRNLLMLLGAVLAVISVLFWSVKAGLLAMIPNAMPILVNFGAMGVLGFELSPGTFSVAMIAFGIAVDDTIHFMVRYHKELRSGGSEEAAIHRSVKKEFRPVLASSVALILGFLVMTVSDFGSIMQFGVLAALSLAAALFSDLFLTPVIFLVSPLVTAWDFLLLKIDETALRESKLFQSLRLAEIKRVALSGKVEVFEKGETVVEEGDEGTDLFFILNGRARVSVREGAGGDRGEDRHLEELGRGGFFGEMALMTQEPRSATVRAVHELEV